MESSGCCGLRPEAGRHCGRIATLEERQSDGARTKDGLNKGARPPCISPTSEEGQTHQSEFGHLIRPSLSRMAHRLLRWRLLRSSTIREGWPMSTEPDLCIDCMGLVGADSRTRPHAALKTVPRNAGGNTVFGCSTCNAAWNLRTQGWARLSDMFPDCFEPD